MSTYPQDLREEDRRHLWHPYTPWSAHQAADFPVIVGGEGICLFDQDRNCYIDAISSWWACPLGHSHPAVVKAIRRQAGRLQHSILGNLTHEPAVRLAAALAELMPDPARHVHFASDGACAVEAALKIAIQYWHNMKRPERHRLVSLRQAYHGDTLATVSLGYLEHFHRPFANVRSPCHQVPVPPYDAPEDEALRVAESHFREHGDRIAAFVVEPLCQGASGMRIYSKAYLRALFDLCQRHETLFIVDEIATGFGRTGTTFAFEQAGIDPDIVCVGKALAAGYLPISAAIVKDKIFDTFRDDRRDQTFYHGHTFAGNPIAAAAALAAQRVYREEDLAGRAAELGARLAQHLRPLADIDGVRDVRCLGMIGAVELHPEESHSKRAPLAQRVARRLRAEGVLLRPLGNVLYLMLPLITPENMLSEVVAALRKAIVQTR